MEMSFVQYYLYQNIQLHIFTILLYAIYKTLFLFVTLVYI